MGILDGIVEWFAEQVMKFLDLINSSVLGALGCNMSTFKRYFPAAETMYKVFVALGIGLILLNLVWQLFKNFGAPLGTEAEDPLKLTLRSAVFILLVYFADEIVGLILKDMYCSECLCSRRPWLSLWAHPKLRAIFSPLGAGCSADRCFCLL